MSTTKNTDKLILNYFKFVNPLPYDEVKINYIEFFDMYDIKIVSENYLDYTRHRRGIKPNDKTVCDQIRYDMEDLFPYTFRVSVVVKRTINKKDGVRTNS